MNFTNSTTSSSAVLCSSTTIANCSAGSHPNSTQNSSSCHCTYSKNETAAIGVGSAFAGVFVALFIGFICLKTRRRSPLQGKLRNIFSRRSVPNAAATPASSTLAATLDRLDDALPQALTHADLAREASQLESAIRNYLDNYIDWDGSPKSPPLDDGRLSELAGGLSMDWKQKLQSRGSRSITLRMFLARFLAAKVDVTCPPGSTLLPPEVMRVYQTVMNGQKKSRNGQALQHTWRAMTAYLVSSTYHQDRVSISTSHPLYEAINREASNVKGALASLRYRRKGTEDRETDVLRDLIAKAALLGLRMFSQRDVTEFFWSRKVEVFPGVRQRPIHHGAIDGASWVTIREPQL